MGRARHRLDDGLDFGAGRDGPAIRPDVGAALASADSIECEVEIEWPDGSKELYTGRFHVESLEIGSPEGQRVTSNVSMQSDGPVEYERVPA